MKQLAPAQESPPSPVSSLGTHAQPPNLSHQDMGSRLFPFFLGGPPVVVLGKGQVLPPV